MHIYLSFYGSLKALYFFSKLVSIASHEAQKQCVIFKRYFFIVKEMLYMFTLLVDLFFGVLQGVRQLTTKLIEVHIMSNVTFY